MMAAMMLLFGQAETRWEWVVRKLLGVDRVNLGGDVELDWHHDLGWPVICLVAVPIIVLLVWLVYRKERRDVGWGAKSLLIGLRSLLALLIFLVLLGPRLTEEIIKVRRGYVLVLVDDSLSMRKTDPPKLEHQKLALARVCRLVDGDPKSVTPEMDEALRGLTRADVIEKVLENRELRVLDDIESKLKIAYFTFSKAARPLEGRAKFFEAYDPRLLVGTETAIGDSMRQAMAMFKAQPVVAVVVFSDGRNNLGVEPHKIAEQLGRQYNPVYKEKPQYVPVYTVLAGIPQKPQDIALVELEAREALLVNDKLPIRFGVKAEGFSGTDVDVNLHVYTIKDPTRDYGIDAKDIETYVQEGKLDQGVKVRIDGSGRQSGEMIWQPRAPGEYMLVLRAPPREEERTDLNNSLVHRVRVADDKIKVLYVEHRPRWEYRYLKNALIRDTKILAHCLLTDADEGFPQEHTKDTSDPDFREPLKEFPRTLKELLKYDVLILGDVDPARLGGREALDNIERFVANFGGGIVFISGVQSNPRAFKETPLWQLLPVIPEEPKSEAEQGYEQPFGYKLTPEALDVREGKGGAHPIVMFPLLGNDVQRTVELWEDRDGHGDGLIGVRWFQRVTRIKPAAKVLVELSGVPGAETGGRRPPLFAAMPYGDGRIFWSGTDETWRWRYLQGDSPWFYPFWQQAMYWTRMGKLLGAKRYRLRLDRYDRRYMMGREVTFYVAAFDSKFEPMKEPELTLYIEPPRGQRQTLQLTKERDRNGYYEGKLTPTDTGLYRVWAGDPEDDASKSIEKFTVYIPNREEDEPILDEEEMRKTAHASHPPMEGDAIESECRQFFKIDDVGSLPARLSASPQNIKETREDDLWDSPLVYLLFALLITTEWILRKAFRML